MLDKSRAKLIQIIDSLFPADSEYVGPRDIGKRLLQQAKDDVNNWRNESIEVLARYAELCEQEETRIARRQNEPLFESS